MHREAVLEKNVVHSGDSFRVAETKHTNPVLCTSNFLIPHGQSQVIDLRI